MDYRSVWEEQIRTHQAVLNGAPDTVIFAEHRPVVTIGRSGGENHLLASEERLRSLGIDLVHSNRGGDVTYHGPGQLVVYPIFDLRRHYLDVHRYLRDLEEVAISVLAKFEITGQRVPGRTGVWTERGKIAAIGVHVKRWVTLHGMAFNVTRQSLEGFKHIIPCGIADAEVACLEDWGFNIAAQDLIDDFFGEFIGIFPGSQPLHAGVNTWGESRRSSPSPTR